MLCLSGFELYSRWVPLGYVMEALSNNSCRVINHSTNILVFFQVLARHTNATSHENICIY